MPLSDRYSGGLGLIVQCGECRHNAFYEFDVDEDRADDCDRCGGPLLIVAVLDSTADVTTDPDAAVIDIDVNLSIRVHDMTDKTVQSIVGLIRDRFGPSPT